MRKIGIIVGTPKSWGNTKFQVIDFFLRFGEPAVNIRRSKFKDLHLPACLFYAVPKLPVLRVTAKIERGDCEMALRQSTEFGSRKFL